MSYTANHISGLPVSSCGTPPFRMYEYPRELCFQFAKSIHSFRVIYVLRERSTNDGNAVDFHFMNHVDKIDQDPQSIPRHTNYCATDTVKRSFNIP